MPPKQKFTREEIIEATLQIISKEGIGVLTARRVAEELNSSPRPIFTIFPSMESLLAETRLAAKNLYTSYIEQGLQEELAFRGVGSAYIQFAVDEPNLFAWLFMSNEKIGATEVMEILKGLDDNNEKILASLMKEYELSHEVAQRMYHHLWIYSHGIAVLAATNIYHFNQEEIQQMTTEVFTGLLIASKYKGEK